MRYAGPSFSNLLVDGYNLAPAVMGSASVGVENLTEQTNPFGTVPEGHTPIGITKATLVAGAGLYDAATDALHSVAGAVTGISRIISAALYGNVPGKPSWGFEGVYSQKYEIMAEMAGLTKANVTYLVSGKAEQGKIIQDLALFTADWDTKTGGANAADTPVDNTVLTSAGGVGYFHCTAISGFSSVVLKIMHSADDVTYAALITSAPFTAIGSQRITVAGTVNRYLSSLGDVTGVGSTWVFSGFSRY